MGELPEDFLGNVYSQDFSISLTQTGTLCLEWKK